MADRASCGASTVKQITRRHPGDVTAIALDLMRQPGGMTGAQLQKALGDLLPGTTSGRIGRLVHQGVAFMVRHSAKPRRYFDSQQRADEWLAQQPGRGGPQNFGDKRHVPAGRKNITYSKGDQAKVLQPGVVYGMDTAPKIVSLAPRGRYEAEPGHVGAFTLAGVGRDVQTGRGWA